MSDSVESDTQRESPVEKKWVQFDENNETSKSSSNAETIPATAASNYNGAVIDTETVQIDIDKLKQLAQNNVPEVHNQEEGLPKSVIPTMRNINLDDLDNPDNNLPTIVDPSIQRGFGMIKII